MPFACAALIKEIGRGKEGARSLTAEQAQALYAAMLTGDVSDIELGAVLIALRVKGESTDELLGFCRAAQALVSPIQAPRVDKPVIVFPSYNGARRRPNLLPLLSGALARLGYPVLIHGQVEDPVGRVTTHAVFEALQWPIAHTGLTDALRRACRNRLPLFVPTAALHSGLVSLLERRRQLGVRNSTHTVVKLLQPVAGPALLVTSYTHPEFLQLQRQVLNALGTPALVLRGHEGEAVAHPQKAPRMDAVSDGQIDCVDPGDSGFSEMPDPNPDRNAAHTAEQALACLARLDQAGLEALPVGLQRQVSAIEALARRLSSP